MILERLSMTGGRARLTLAILAAAVLAPSLAFPSLALAQLDTRSPIDLSADSSVVDNATCISEWRGNVEALQGRTRLRSDSMKVHGVKGNCGQADSLVADGNVYYVTADRNVRADHATYDAGSEIITLTGNVIIVQGKNVVRADKAVINTKTGETQLQSAGRAKGGRVRGVFYPSDKPSTRKP
jgi:lipopolysaccharide export system protein LptA